MTVSNETVINKMIQQLEKAKMSIHDEAIVVDHISKVKLLAELILEDCVEKSPTIKQEKPNYIPMEKNYVDNKIAVKTVEEDETSIFDF